MLSLTAYQSIFRSAQAGESLLARDATVLDANEAFLQLIGGTREEVVGHSLFDLLSAGANGSGTALVATVRKSLAAVIASRKTETLPVQRHTRKRAGRDSEERYWTGSLRPVFDPNGQLLCIVYAATDVTDSVTEKRRIEEELRRSVARQRFQSELTQKLRTLDSPDEIIAATSELLAGQLGISRIIYWELDATSTTLSIRRDWSREGLPSISGQVKRLEEFGSEVMAAIRVGRTVAVDDVKNHPLTQDCAEAYSAINARALLSIPLVKSGRLTTVLNLLHVEPRQWLEADIDLARDVAERTWSALESARARDELHEANVRKDEFLAMLAHELRNPLAPISAAAELMKMVRLSETMVKQTTQLITRQVSHMTGLVDDLLDVSRVTRGLITINKLPLDVKSVVSHAVEQVRPLMETEGHHFEVELPEQSPQVLGDLKRLVQVLTNLLNNAAKYTPSGGRIRLKMDVLEDRVLFHVEDNGIGMAPELQTRIFDLFSQAERSSDRSQGGLGLGLPLVRSLVERHDGTVSCRSDGLGKGSSFTVCLPILTEQQVAEQSADEGTSIPAAASSLRILVVDDNVDAAETLAMLLQASGHDVMVEFGAKQALERAKQEKPDVCLLDIGLPEIDGNELARRLRTQPETADVALIAITGYGQEQDRKTALAAGFNHHLVKPVDTLKLHRFLNEIAGA